MPVNAKVMTQFWMSPVFIHFYLLPNITFHTFVGMFVWFESIQIATEHNASLYVANWSMWKSNT